AAELAVPVRAELLNQVMEFHARAMRTFSRAMAERRMQLRGLVRALPRAEALFAAPRQRFDVASERLGNGLRRNLQIHRVRFLKAESRLQPRAIQRHIEVSLRRVSDFGQRIVQNHRAHVAAAGKRLEGLARVLDSVSYRAVLSRGFALVRGEDGGLRRAASAIASGERLELTFADGKAEAIAGSRPATPRKPSKPGGKQGTLF
ncbi:MAG TPA: exodeoxyribonuclease VII large subunit, partial [Rhizomicrobium sp.]|nr:exodeoxyribonuclease VII large subunit [Rhizomicrobium sp.]